MLLLFPDEELKGGAVIGMLCPCRCFAQVEAIPLLSKLKALERAEQRTT
jgi:hypothetical protein